MNRMTVNVKQLGSFLIISFMLLVSGCKDYRSADYQIGESTEHIQFSDFVDSIKAISVNEDSFVIGAARKIVKAEESYYVLSQKQDAIIECDESGMTRAILHRLGHAKDEYTKIVDFSIDETNKTIVTLCAGNKLMVYDMSFNLKYVKDLNSFCASVCAYKGNIFCYTNNRQIVKITDSGLDVMLKGEEFPAYVYELTPVFHKVGDRLFAVMEYDNTIYELENDDFVPIMVYDYPKQTKTIERMRKNEAMVELDDILEHSSVSVSSLMLQNERLVIIYSYDVLFRACVIDLSTKKLLKDGLIIGDFPKWISKSLCLGTAFAKDFAQMHANDNDKIVRVGGDDEDSNLIIEYYLHI